MSKEQCIETDSQLKGMKNLRKTIVVSKGHSLPTSRAAKQEPRCGFGLVGLSCRICHQGPCRIDPFGHGPLQGICGADADLIVARHWLQYVSLGGIENYQALQQLLLELKVSIKNSYLPVNENKLAEIMEILDVSSSSISVQTKNILQTIEKGLTSDYTNSPWYDRLRNGHPKETKRTDLTSSGVNGFLAALSEISLSNLSLPETILEHSIDLATWTISNIIAPYSQLQRLYSTKAKSETIKSGMGKLRSSQINILLLGENHHIGLQVASAVNEINTKTQSKSSRVNLLSLGLLGQKLAENDLGFSLGDTINQEVIVWGGYIDAIIILGKGVYPGLQDPINANLIPVFHYQKNISLPGSQELSFSFKDLQANINRVVTVAHDHAKNRFNTLNFSAKDQYSIPIGTNVTLEKLLTENTETHSSPLIDEIKNGLIKGIALVVGEVTAKDRLIELESTLKQLLGNGWFPLVSSEFIHQLAQNGISISEINKWPNNNLKKAIKNLKQKVGLQNLPSFLLLDSYFDVPSSLLLIQKNLRKANGDIKKLPLITIIPQFTSNTSIVLLAGLAGLGLPIYTMQAPPILGSKLTLQFFSETLPERTNGFIRFMPKIDQIMNDLESK